MSLRTARRLATTMAAVAAIGACATPASAQGFFEQLFGGGFSAPTPAPAPQYNAPAPGDPGFFSDRPLPSQQRRKKVADDKPVLQTPTDLMHDKTLQAGDAVMMKDGLHVYTGPESDHHTKRQFASLDATRAVGKGERLRLAALDPTKVAPGVQEARSASEIVTGYKITDARGRSVRYVGP